MKAIEEQDDKINKIFELSSKKITFIENNKVTKGIFLYAKKKGKTRMIDSLLAKGIITNIQHREYLKKITKEWELSKNNVENLTEIIFETDDCNMSSVYANGEIRYCINQYGMKEYYKDFSTALERFVLITV